MTGSVIHGDEGEKVYLRTLSSLTEAIGVPVGRQVESSVGASKFQVGSRHKFAERVQQIVIIGIKHKKKEEMADLNQILLANKMIVVIDSHKPISEKRKSRNGNSRRVKNGQLFNGMKTREERDETHSKEYRTREAHCQVMNRYRASTIIYILLHLLLICATSSQATSQIKSIWVSREDLHREQLKAYNSPESSLRRPPPPVSGERRPDFEQTSAGGQQVQLGESAASAKKNGSSSPAVGLHASASSLQPVAIEPEASHQSGKQQVVAQRRSSQPISGDDSASHSFRPTDFKSGHLQGASTNLSDELASSLDHQWLRQSHNRLTSAPNMSASVSNAQVHFDEDSRDHQQHYNHNLKLGASKLYPIDTNARRQDAYNATEPPASNYAPKHETFTESQAQFANKTSGKLAHTSDSRYGPAYPIAGDNYENDDLSDSLVLDNRTASLTFARGDQPLRQNFSHHAHRDLHSPPPPPQPQVLEQPPAIYYLPDGDKWNRPAPEEEHSQLDAGVERSRSHQYSQQGVALDDARRQRRRPAHGNSDQLVFPASGLDETLADIITARPIENVHWPAGGLTGAPNLQLGHDFVQKTPQPSDLFYGPGQVATTTPVPADYPAAQFGPDLSGAMREQIYLSQYANPTTAAPPLTTFDQQQQQPRRQAPPTILPQTLHQFINGGAYNYLPVPPRGHNNNRAQAATRVINLGEVPYGSQFSASASGPKTSLFGNYNPMQLMGVGGKTKKSLLSTINEKLNTWTGSASDSDVRHLIENSFYEQQQQPNEQTHRRRRPGMTQSGSNPRNRNPLLTHGYSLPPPPLMYGPIRQPTVAPASSTLGNFYGGHQASASVNRHIARPMSYHNQRHPNAGGQQQAASFIPVVAVQVTRTSPAPNAHTPDSSSAQADRLDEQYVLSHAGQPGTDSLSANEIDEYLASRTGHLSASKQHQAASNLNARQKWDDSYGSGAAAAATGQRYQTSRFYQDSSSPARARRRHVINSSPSQPGQHETTIKSAVFGYLPHQADAPLLQAMNMLEQLPAGQVQHHHHHHHTSQMSAGSRPKQPVDRYSYSGEMYANQMDKSRQSVEAATPPLDYQSLAAVAAAAAANQQQQPFQAPIFQASGPEEQPMSLALQLQANNYLQNDIAHPFASRNSGTTYPRVPSSKHAPLDVIYSSGGGTDPAKLPLHYPAFQFMSPSQLGAYQDQLAQIMAQSPLLMKQNNPHLMSAGEQSSASSHAPHPYQGHSGKHSEFSAGDNHLLATAPNDLNPLLMSPLFYQNSPGSFPSTDQFYNLYQPGGDPHKTLGSQTNADQGATSGDDEQSSGDQDSQSTKAPSEGSQRNQGVGSKGKKRSSDFFANAGQLLLSALPLLLAPTLGLMFASSPANPVARFHGAHLGQASGGLPGSLGAGQSHGGFANGMPLDDGLVMNASPAPQLFTPSPPGSQFAGGASASNYAPETSFSNLLMDRFNETFGGGGDQATTLAPPPPLPTTTTTTGSASATTRPPNQYYKTSNSLPALTGFRLDGPTRNKSTGSGGLPNRSATSSTTTHRPFAIIMTTLGPPPAASNESTFSTDLNSSASGGSGGEFGRNRTTPTILVFESSDSDQERNSGINQSESLQSSAIGHSDEGTRSDQDPLEPRRQQNTTSQRADIRRSSSAPHAITTRAPNATTIMYDIGYEGADFDSQFATLRKNSLEKSQYLATLAPAQLGVNERKHTGHNYVKDKSHYQYDELPAPIRSGPTTEPNSKHKDSNRFDDSSYDDSSAPGQQGDSKLYPVSSWPPMRRKTVSLITSSGNKTLFDSSDRYAGLMAATGVNGHSRNRVAQNSKRDQLSGTGSESQQNNSVLVGGRPSQQAAVIYDDEQPLAGHRALSRLEVGNQPNLVARRHSSSSNSTTTRQQLNKRRLSTLDNFVVESAPPVDSSLSTRPHRRRKRDLSSGPLGEPASSNSIGSAGESPDVKVKSAQPKLLKATGQVVKLKNKSRKLLRRVKKRTKRVERRQDTLVADHYSPQLGASLNETHLMPAFNQTGEVQFPPRDNYPTSHQLPHQQSPVNMATTYEPGQPFEETLRRDASKSKSAIVTAMITHVADGGDDRDQDEGGEDSAGVSHEELREQLLAKKLLLDRLATRTGATASNELDYQQQTDEQQFDAPPEFNAGGRGRFKPAPVLDYVPYGVDQPVAPVSQLQNFSATRFINNRAAVGGRNRLRSRNLVGELNEDTKRALAKFGTLLLEDTLEQLPPADVRNETRRPFPTQNRKRSLSRSRHSNTPPNAYGPAAVAGPFVPAMAPHSQGSGQYDSYESGSATERYSTRATQAPLPLAEDTASGWSRHYPKAHANGTTGYFDQPRDRHDQDAFNYTRPLLPGGHPASGEWPKAAHKNEHTLTYQYPHGRERANSQVASGDLSGPRNSSQAESDARYEHFHFARTSGGAGGQQQPAAGDENYAPGSGQRELGVGSQAVAFKTPNGSSARQTSGHSGSPIDRYNSFLVSHLGGGGGANATGPARLHNATSGSPPPPSEQLDARYSTYSNYSTVAPAYHHDHAHAPRPDGHPYDLAHHHHPDDRYRDGAPPAAYDPRAPRNPGAQYPAHESDHYSTHNSSQSYPPPPPDYDHHYRQPVAHPATANYPASYRDHHHYPSRQPMLGDEYPPTQPPVHHHQGDMSRGPHASRNPYSPDHPAAMRYYSAPHYRQPQHYAAHNEHSSSSTTYAPASSHQTYGERAPPPLVPPGNQQHYYRGDPHYASQQHDPSAAASRPPTESTKAVNDYLKRVQFSDSDRDKLMASYLTCDGLLNDNDHCLERLSCEFSDPQNIERANKLDRAVSSILLGHILINTYIPKAFKLRLKSASLFGYTQSGKCSKFACSKLAARQSAGAGQLDSSADDDAKSNNTDR